MPSVADVAVADASAANSALDALAVTTTDTAVVQTHTVSDRQAFENLVSDWEALSNIAPSACVFNSWQWMISWWDVFYVPGDKLQIWSAWHDDRLIALLPMYSRSSSFGPGRVLRFIGTGESRADEVGTEYSDILFDPKHAAIVLPKAIEWITGFSNWSRIDLLCVLEQASLVRALQQLAPDVHKLNVVAGFRYRVPLGDVGTSPLKLIAGSKQGRIERSVRALERDGGLQRQSLTDVSEVGSFFNSLAELNRERQVAKNRTSSFDSEKFCHFHLTVLPALLASAKADIHRYYLGDELLAALYCFYDAGTTYYYQSGFKTDSANKYMPLTSAHMDEVQRSRDRGRKYYDLMRAEPPSYKQTMASDTAELLHVFVFGSHRQLRLFRFVKSTRRHLVMLLNRVGIRRA